MKIATAEVKRLRLMARLIQSVQELGLEDQEYIAKKITEAAANVRLNRLNLSFCGQTDSTGQPPVTT